MDITDTQIAKFLKVFERFVCFERFPRTVRILAVNHVMSGKASNDGQRIWSYYRGSKLGFWLMVGLGSAVCVGAMYKLLTSSDGIGFVIIFAGGILWILWASFIWGDTDIVFDDNTQSIYVRKKRCCSNCSSNKKVGDYSAFKQCSVKEGRESSSSGGRGSTKVYSLDFMFKDGSIYEGDNNPYGEETKYRIAQEINDWWKTTPYYKPSGPVPVAGVQMVVQQPPFQTVVIQQQPNQTVIPVAAGHGQVPIYANMQQPVVGQPVYQHVAPHGQAQVVYVQQ